MTDLEEANPLKGVTSYFIDIKRVYVSIPMWFYVVSPAKTASSTCPFSGNVRQFDHNQVTMEMPMTTAFFV
ncbi:hypothetical protein MJL79_25735, partial [Salmonella enterica subsp. enterica serovar Montevideo]|nr:hypothetical protein [Salmonella enterica subsp. enterica serovar Montevideo]